MLMCLYTMVVDTHDNVALSWLLVQFCHIYIVSAMYFRVVKATLLSSAFIFADILECTYHFAGFIVVITNY